MFRCSLRSLHYALLLAFIVLLCASYCSCQTLPTLCQYTLVPALILYCLKLYILLWSMIVTVVDFASSLKKLWLHTHSHFCTLPTSQFVLMLGLTSTKANINRSWLSKILLRLFVEIGGQELENIWELLTLISNSRTPIFVSPALGLHSSSLPFGLLATSLIMTFRWECQAWVHFIFHSSPGIKVYLNPSVT